jgi:hypothetical protein
LSGNVAAVVADHQERRSIAHRVAARDLDVLVADPADQRDVGLTGTVTSART